jgi:hypothetical protein
VLKACLQCADQNAIESVGWAQFTDQISAGFLVVQKKSTYLDAGYPDRFGLSGKFVQKSTKLTCLEITGYRIK